MMNCVFFFQQSLADTEKKGEEKHTLWMLSNCCLKVSPIKLLYLLNNTKCFKRFFKKSKSCCGHLKTGFKSLKG